MDIHKNARLTPLVTRLAHVFALGLGGQQRLFLKDMPAFSSTRDNEVGLRRP